MRMMLAGTVFFCAALALPGCQWAITPDPEADSWAPLHHEYPPSLVEIGPDGSACTRDQGDECPLVNGRTYIIVYCYGRDRDRAYELKDLLAVLGVDVVVGHQFSHGMFFVRSRKGYDWDDPASRSEAIELMSEATTAMEQIRRDRPGALETRINNEPPYALPAMRP
ncbi:MAG: hypothetical protein BIFFINMI_03161 [Phycisphaerae bacterium]|nr:hypothetical protein [Phycisphaerae bacterium]